MKKNVTTLALSNEEQAKQMLEFIKDMHANVITGKDGSNWVVFDCTYTSCKKGRMRSWGSKEKARARYIFFYAFAILTFYIENQS